MRKVQTTPYYEVTPFIDVALEDEIYEAEKHLLLGTKESAEVLARTLYGWYKQDQVHTAPTYIARAYFGYFYWETLERHRARWMYSCSS